MVNNQTKSEKTKNTIVYVLVAIILALSVAVAGGAYYVGYHTGTDDYIRANTSFTLGSIDGNRVYTNEFVDLKYELPKNMNIDIDFLQEFKKTSTITVFDATVPGTDESVKLSFTNLKKIFMGQRKTGEEYAKQMRKACVGGIKELSSVDLDSELKVVTIGGREFFEVYNYTSTDGYNKAMYVQRLDEYICTIDITTKGAVDDVLSTFSAIEK